jgi:ECF sigma factor
MNSVLFDVGEVTRLLQSARGGDPGALERLVPLVYEDLRRLARRQLGHEYGERTLSATALVHESYLKLAAGALAATDRAHFLAIAARGRCWWTTPVIGRPPNEAAGYGSAPRSPS